MSGPLIELVDSNASSQPFQNNMATKSHISSNKTNTGFRIDHVADIIILDGFIIPESINLNNINVFDIYCAGYLIYSIPFDIITAISNIEIKNNQYFIKFPHELFNIDSNTQYLKKHLLFPIISVSHNDFSINLRANTDFDYKIITKNIYYKDEIRRELTQPNKYHIDIYQYESFDINKESFVINANFISTGLYVITTSKLTFFKLYLNQNVSRYLSEDLIDFYSFLIYQKESDNIDTKSKYVYFIPFNTLNNELDGVINFDRISNVQIDLTTKDNIYEGKIYNKYINRFKINYEGTVKCQT